jgi:hypothetical protein
MRPMTVPAVWQRTTVLEGIEAQKRSARENLWRVLGGGWARIPTRSLLCPNRLAKPATRVIIAY